MFNLFLLTILLHKMFDFQTKHASNDTEFQLFQTPKMTSRAQKSNTKRFYSLFSVTSINRALDSTARRLFAMLFWPNAHLPLVTQRGAYFLILLGRKWNCNNCALVSEEPACPACRENFLCCSAGRLYFSLCSVEVAEGSPRLWPASLCWFKASEQSCS